MHLCTCTDELIQLDYQVTVVPGIVPSVVDLNHIRATLVGPNAKFLLQCGPNANVLSEDVRMRIKLRKAEVYESSVNIAIQLVCLNILETAKF